MSGPSQAFLVLTILLLIFTVLVLRGFACNLAPGGTCGRAIVLPGNFIVVGNYWPLAFLPSTLVGLCFFYTLNSHSRTNKFDPAIKNR